MRKKVITGILLLILFFLVLTPLFFYGKNCPQANWVSINWKKANNPPVTPSRPRGPILGKKDEYCCGFRCCTTDPEDDKIHYIWDFGDGCGVGTICFECGCECCINHCWENYGIYQIRVMAMDEHYLFSKWSPPHFIAILFWNSILCFLFLCTHTK